MTQERWDYLMQPFEGDESVMLTAEELANGWHWCDEWDGLLIHTDDIEFHHCKCGFMEKFRTPERMNKIKKDQDKFCLGKVRNPQIFNLKPGLVDTPRVMSYTDNKIAVDDVVQVVSFVLDHRHLYKITTLTLGL
jgi:hypothetical protein